MKSSLDLRKKSSILYILFLIAAVILLLPAASQAEEKGKKVRVGWYDSTYNTLDQSGRRSGYAYEYQIKISAYTGWNYEYVKGSWSTLLQMLQDGDIDLMSDVSYTDKRAEKMFYASLPMGTEEYYLFIAPNNREILSTDYSTLNGKRSVLTKTAFRRTFFGNGQNKMGSSQKL